MTTHPAAPEKAWPLVLTYYTSCPSFRASRLLRCTVPFYPIAPSMYGYAPRTLSHITGAPKEPWSDSGPGQALLSNYVAS